MRHLFVFVGDSPTKSRFEVEFIRERSDLDVHSISDKKM